MIRRYIAIILFRVLAAPIGWVIDKIYPEGTQQPMRAWFNPEQGKVRFLFGGMLEMRPDSDTAGVGMKLENWKILSQGIDQQIREYENMQVNAKRGIL